MFRIVSDGVGAITAAGVSAGTPGTSILERLSSSRRAAICLQSSPATDPCSRVSLREG